MLFFIVSLITNKNEFFLFPIYQYNKYINKNDSYKLYLYIKYITDNWIDATV